MDKARILIVEDEAIIAAVIAAALKKFEYEVIDILDSGEAAAARALEKRPDLVLMDIRLQGELDGIAAVERIQEEADIPVIYLTAYADELTLERAKRTRPYGYIPKPFQEIELKTTIEMALHKHVFEIRLRESEKRFRSLFENSPDVIYIVDNAWRLQEMNSAGERLFGYAHDEFIGRTPEFLYADPGDREKFLAEIREKKEVKNFAVELRNRRGDPILARITASAILDRDGNACGVQGIIRDVTRETRLEEQMLQTAKLDSLGQLASGIAHDFNNYLTIINGYSEMLLSENESGKEAENLKIILQAGKSASKLVAKILGFSRRQAPAPAVLEVNAALGELERMVRRLVGERIALRLDLAADAGNVFIDPGQLEQVIINLVINARDAMPRGGGLRLASEPAHLDADAAARRGGLDPGDYVEIRVEDGGAGMEPQVLERVFEPFFTTKPAGEGTGLGLALVFGIVQQNRGTIWAESEPGQGSTFHVLLPRSSAAVAEANKPRPARRFEGRVVLLIEDEPSIRQLLRAILQSLGMEVHEAGSGEEGLQAARGMAKVDLLLSDVILPGLSGVEVAERLFELHPRAAVILSSGQGENYLKRAGVDLDKVHFLPKPSSRKAIEDKIAEVLG
jgi:PAS domain S-box-containing protein